MTSDANYTQAFVWVWLPDQTEPVVAGLLSASGKQLVFNYGRSYLARNDAIPLYEPELPLRSGILPLTAGLSMPNCIRDAAPDAWGRRIIINRKFGAQGRNVDPGNVDELTYLLESGSDRTGALDFQTSSANYVAREGAEVSLHELLAAAVGLTVAPVSLARAAGKDVLLIERFDRVKVEGGWSRKAMVSALTLLELDELMARYASYEQLATIIRHRFQAPRETLKEIFARMLFNVLCGNTDDHARNHAAFWNGKELSLTPAYDICPQNRTGGEATQAMLILGQERASQIALCLKAAPLFLMNNAEAILLATKQVKTIKQRWSAACDEAKLSKVDRNFLWRRQFLNPYAFLEAPEAIRKLID